MAFLGNCFADVAWYPRVVTRILLPVSLQSGSFFPLSSSTAHILVLVNLMSANYGEAKLNLLPNAEEEKMTSNNRLGLLYLINYKCISGLPSFLWPRFPLTHNKPVVGHASTVITSEVGEGSGRTGTWKTS